MHTFCGTKDMIMINIYNNEIVNIFLCKTWVHALCFKAHRGIGSVLINFNP